MTTYVLRDNWIEHTDELAEWAAVNGLDADLMPDWGSVVVNGGELTVHEVITEPGSRLAAAYVDNRAVTRLRTVPLVKAPDPALWAERD